MGYGNISVGGVVRSAHRLSYELAYGQPPDGALVLHSCDTRCCVNPAHLRAGSYTDNSRDCVSRGRHFTPTKGGERNQNAILTAEQVVEIRKRTSKASVYAEKYGVGVHTIYHIWEGKSWLAK